MIRVRFRKNAMEATGHAGFAPKGEDLVCAAFSMLVFTLEANLRQIDPPGLEIISGPGEIKMRWNESAKAEQALRFTQRGVNLLAEKYPQWVETCMAECYTDIQFELKEFNSK